jgi:quinol monooxygenase YgiN
MYATLKAKPGREEFLAKECLRLAKMVRENEKDCLVYFPCVSIDDSSVIVFVEKYTDSAAFDYHRQTPYIKEFRERVEDALAEPTRIDRFDD